MALQDAAAAKSAAEANKPVDGAVYDSKLIVHIDAKITEAHGSGLFIYNEDFKGRVSGGVDEIEQPDRSYISCADIVEAITKKDYQVSVDRFKNPDGTLFLRMKIWWG